MAIPALATVHPDGTADAAVGGALLPNGRRIPLNAALQVLIRYAEIYGPLELTTVFPDGRVIFSAVTAHGITPTSAAGGPGGSTAAAPAAGHFEDDPDVDDMLKVLAVVVKSLPNPESDSPVSRSAQRYRAPGLATFWSTRTAAQAGKVHNLFQGAGLSGGDTSTAVPPLSAGAGLGDVPEFDVEGDMQRALLKIHKRSPVPVKALLAAAGARTLCVVAAMMLF